MTSFDFTTIGDPKMKYSKSKWGNHLNKDTYSDNSNSCYDNNLLRSPADSHTRLLPRKLGICV